MPLTLLLAAVLLPSPARACGGMFCDAVTPVDQSAERIIFSFDSGGFVDTEVQITYSGQDDDFAWVVPVPAEPELYVSNDALFTALANATIPTYTLQTAETWYEKSCAGLTEVEPPPLPEFGTADYTDTADTDSGAINVVSTLTVGPYDTVVLQATDADVLVLWLQDQGYNLPEQLSTVLEPYVAEGQYFVALKLSSDKDTGDLTPLGMRYPATAASIPIQLTSVAAVPDLPIEVFVLGESRAVPDNYLHVTLNEAALDWFGGTANYRSVVAKAADEAGGQAFATDFVGPTANLGVRVWTEGVLHEEELAAEPDPIRWLNVVLGAVTASAQLTAFLPTVVPPPDGVDATSFLACPDCYAEDYVFPDWDPAAATTALDAAILTPLRAQQARLDRSPTLTRLFTTMDPSEMTADPIFVQNADLPQEVSATHVATQHLTYIDGALSSLALETAEGITYDIADPAAPSTEGIDKPSAMVISDLGATGAGTVLFDGTKAAKYAAEVTPDGCGGQDLGAAAPLLLLGAGLLRRRRR